MGVKGRDGKFEGEGIGVKIGIAFDMVSGGSQRYEAKLLLKMDKSFVNFILEKSQLKKAKINNVKKK